MKGRRKNNLELNSLAWIISRVFDPVIEIPLLLAAVAIYALTNGLRIRFLMFLLIVVISILHTTGLEVMYLGFAGFKMLTWSVIGVFLLIAFTTGGMSNLIYYYGLKKVTASKSTIYELFFPFSSILLEFLLHGKILSLGQWFGVLVVLFSVSKIVVLKNK